MISKINTSGYNQSFAVCNYGADGIWARKNRNADPAAFSLAHEQARVDGYIPSWSNGTGTLIDSTGAILFEASGFGGSFSSLVLANRGSTTVYYGVNDNNILVASGTPLQSGESIQIVDNIYSLWAVTASSSTYVTAQGIVNQNPNTI